jgi:glycosyltransferase involved in cell wall biosynthesis
MRALPEILRRRPRARAVVVGANGVSYGPAPRGTTWKDVFLREVHEQLDMERVHFVGNIAYDTYISLLQVSAAHVYLTYPFVLSWSMLEAMAAGCAVIGSRTPPVEEVITDGFNGLLVDFHSPSELAERTIEVLARPSAYARIRRQARTTIVNHYDLRTICLPRHLKLIDEVVNARIPPDLS